jgi:hypothetical protein
MLAMAAYRLLLCEIAGGTKDNNDSVVFELDGAVKPSASVPGAFFALNPLSVGTQSILLAGCCPRKPKLWLDAVALSYPRSPA